MARRRLAVDWQACKAHGVCAELLPEIVQLDEWGYPVIAPGPVPATLRGFAQQAVKSCPTLALRLVEGQEAPPAAAPAPPPPPDSPFAGITAPDGPRRRARRSS